MKTTPEQRAVWRGIRWQVPQVSRDQMVPGMSRPDIAALLADLDEALSELAALRAVAEAGRAWLRAEDAEQEPVRLFCEGIGSQIDAAHAIDTTAESLIALREALRAWEGRER